MTGVAECTGLYFAGLYNFVADEEGVSRPAAFAALMVGAGGYFVPARPGAVPLRGAAEVGGHFERAQSDPWVGRVVLPPEVVQREMERYVRDGQFDLEWERQLKAWLRVLKTYPDLWISLDLPGEAHSAATVISYWTYEPSFVSDEDDGSRAPQDGRSPDEAARILVDDVYVAIDNLFSALVFDLGQFAYPSEELRKLAFIYGVRVPGPDRIWSGDHSRFKPLLSRTLLAALKETITATRIGEQHALLYSSGFVGMTGQPRMGKTPDLFLLVADATHPHDDEVSLEIFRSLAELLRLSSYLGAVGEAYVPEVRRLVEQMAGNARQVSGKAQQLLVDTNLARTVGQMSVLVDREQLLSRDLLELYERITEMRGYLSNFFASAVSARQLVRTLEDEWQPVVVHGHESVLSARTYQADRLLEDLRGVEATLVPILQEFETLDVSTVGARQSLRSSYRSLLVGRDSDENAAVETCFVLMPFRPELDEIYKEIVLPLFDEAGFGLRCYRGDEIFGTSAIIQDIWHAIRRARVVIAELTGRNPNVLYELGLAHVLRKPAILLTQSMEDVPFDLRHLRCILYSLGPAGLRKLKSDLDGTVRQVLASGAREVALFEN
ncbi:hypothetical protein ABT294_36540 [Nonomuraea sp. NPDC000554]|uniref:hypothetical protein n=1 Tax=Nonomuraea sp. NPDC000554 TaxID=3154259 RepID=UPI003331A57D